ncbi:MAG: vWA domain-containing protein [Polyangiaceae bacterium]
MRQFRWLALGAVAGLGAAAYACGSDGQSEFDGGSGEEAGADASFDGTVVGGGVCVPACAPGELCSVTNACIPVGTCAADGDCTGGKVCTASDGGAKTCTPGGACGSTRVTADAIPPNLLITLDRSCSMTGNVALGDGGTAKKWVIAVGALEKLLTDYDGKIRFGLLMFPQRDGVACGEDGGFPFPVAPGQETNIRTTLKNALDASDTNYPNGPCVTNIDTAIERAATDPGLADKTRGEYVLLVTDGQQSSCNLGGGAAGALAAVHQLATDAGVSTFAIGFGGASDPKFLSNVAIEGGTALPDASFPNLFYNAANDVSLSAALAQIATKTLSCSLILKTVPPDPSKLYVFVAGGVEVTRDPSHASGWDYDSVSNTVTFFGATCDGLKSGSVSDVEVVYGCPAPPAK